MCRQRSWPQNLAAVDAEVGVAEVYVGRQPIFASDLAVLGYELLFRGSETNLAQDPETKTSIVVVNSALEIGLDQLVGDRLAFVNMPRELLVSDGPLPLSPDLVVLEILEDVGYDIQVADACQRLRAQGYVLALDDFTEMDARIALLPLVTYVKIDILALGPAGVLRALEDCRSYPVKLIAECVETSEQLEWCRNLGFDYFQGYLFSRPVTVTAHVVSPSRAVCLGLMAKLSNADVDIDEIERIVRADPALSYKMLRAAAAGAARGLARSISSVREAVVLLGQRRLRRWTMLLLLTGTDIPSSEHLQTAIVRAAMCEELAHWIPGCNADMAFTVGLLSALDILMEMPVREVLATLPVDERIRTAVLERGGTLGAILTCVCNYEQGDLDVPAELEVENWNVLTSYLAAVRYGQTVCATALRA